MLSPKSSEPSLGRHRSDLVGGYHSVAFDAVERDPPQGSEGFVADSGVGSERSALLTSRVLFPQEEEVQIEEVLEPFVSLPSPLPPDYPFIVEYIKPESERPGDPPYYT